MTGGCVLVLGPVGENFAAGMTGGYAIVLDLRETLDKKTNFEHVEMMPISDPECESYQEKLIELLDAHINNTNSLWAQKVKNNLANYLDYFMLVIPKTTGYIKEQKTESDKVSLRVIK